MTNKKSKNKNKSLLESLSGQQSILTIPRIYVQFTGSHILGLFLNQCIFFSGISKKENGEFYKSYDDWYEETLLTKRQILYCLKKLQHFNFITTRIKKANGAPTVHYTVDIQKVESLLNDYFLPQCDKVSHKDKKEALPVDKCCTKVDPVLQNVTMDSDKMSQSIVTKCHKPYTDELTDELKEDKEKDFFLNIKTKTQKLLEKKKIPYTEDILCQIEYYVLKSRGTREASQSIDIAITLHAKKEWKIPNGYNGLTTQAIIEREKKHEQKKQSEIQQAKQNRQEILSEALKRSPLPIPEVTKKKVTHSEVSKMHARTLLASLTSGVAR